MGLRSSSRATSLALAGLLLTQSACGGLGVADFRQRAWVHQMAVPDPPWPRDAFNRVLPRIGSEAGLREEWGPPDAETVTPSGCKELVYDTGFGWSGVVVFAIVRVPLLVPTTRTRTRAFFRDGRLEAWVHEGGEERTAYAMGCGNEFRCSAYWATIPNRVPPAPRCVADPCAEGC